jgi:uncharacterized protein YjbJ (UPF0337 family)
LCGCHKRQEGIAMGWLDKLMGRGKKAAGDMMDDPGMRDEGRHQEAAGEADDRASVHEEMAQEERQREATERSESDT